MELLPVSRFRSPAGREAQSGRLSTSALASADFSFSPASLLIRFFSSVCHADTAIIYLLLSRVSGTDLHLLCLPRAHLSELHVTVVFNCGRFINIRPSWKTTVLKNYNTYSHTTLLWKRLLRCIWFTESQ